MVLTLHYRRQRTRNSYVIWPKQFRLLFLLTRMEKMELHLYASPPPTAPVHMHSTTRPSIQPCLCTFLHRSALQIPSGELLCLLMAAPIGLLDALLEVLRVL